jgi:glycosyltransferase involved in cell wall biosynthesis
MRIIIDLQACQSDSRTRGIGRYSMSLAINMVKQFCDRGHDVWLVLNDNFPDTIESINTIFREWIPNNQIIMFTSLGSIESIEPENTWRVCAAEYIREYFIEQLQPDFIHVASLFEGWGDNSVVPVGNSDNKFNTAITLYDLIPFALDDIYLQDVNYKAFYLRKIEQLKQANLLLAISEHSRKESIDLLGFNPEQVVNISAAIDLKFKPVILSKENRAELLLKYNIFNNFILYVPGGFDPRKNFERLIEAFSVLPDTLKSQYQLVISSKLYPGNRESLEEFASSHGILSNQFILTDYVPDDDLIALYSLCTLYVFPSIHEGFGLPALEAMACGAAVIGANTTSIPEVIGREDALFDPYSIESISNKLFEVLSDKSFIEILKTHSLIHSAKFCWERSALLAVNAIEASYDRTVKTSNVLYNPNLLNIDVIVKSILNNLKVVGEICEPAEKDLSMLDTAVKTNTTNSKLNQLFVDISQLVTVDAKTGIQRVVRSILLQLLRHQPKGYLVVPVYSQGGEKFKQAANFTARFLGNEDPSGEDSYIDYSKGDVFLGLDLTAHLFPIINTVLKDMRLKGVKINYVVYDLTPLINREWHQVGTATAFVDWIDSLAHHADGLICISDSVAKDLNEWLVKYFPEQKEKLEVSFFHLGSDIHNSAPTFGLPDDAANVLEIIKRKPSFLSVATIEPRKGYDQILSAFEVLWQQGHDLNFIIVGKAGWNTEELIEKLSCHPELNHRLFWLEEITDEYLEKIYKASTCLIAASESEGFGLPLIEAAQHKLPIIARDIPVFREVAMEHAYYFSGRAGQELASSINEWLSQYEQNKAPKSDDLTWLTWEQSTNQLMNILRNK